MLGGQRYSRVGPYLAHPDPAHYGAFLSDWRWCPMILSFDRIEMQTSVRLAGVKSLLQLLKDVASEQDLDSEYLERKQAELREFAQERGLEAQEYFSEREVLDYELKSRLPQITAFAIVTQLLTILEVHLRECAKRVEKRMNLYFGPDDLKGRGIEKYAKYLCKSRVYNAKEDQAAWHEVTDLRAIRNLIVHEAGTDIKEKDAKRLKETYKEGFNYSKDESGWWMEVWISPDLCQRFTERVQALTQECLLAVKRAELHDDD